MRLEARQIIQDCSAERDRIGSYIGDQQTDIREGFFGRSDVVDHDTPAGRGHVAEQKLHHLRATGAIDANEPNHGAGGNGNADIAKNRLLLAGSLEADVIEMETFDWRTR